MSDFIAVKGKIDTEMKQYILNTQDVEQALVDIGIDIENKETWEYGDLIRSKKPELDKVPVLEAEVEELTTQNNGLIASNEELQAENENLTSQNTELITQVNDLTNSNNELTDQVETLTEQSAEDTAIIDDAILAVQEKGGTVEDKSQLPTAIRAIEGNAENNFHKYFVDGERNIEAYLDKLASGNIIKMDYMLQNASLTGGKTYLLDVSSCLTDETINYIFYNTVANGGEVGVVIKTGVNNTTLYRMMYNDKVNTYGWNISFADDTDCSNLSEMIGAFRANKIASIDLTNISTAPLTEISHMFRGSNIGTMVLPLDTSNVDSFYYTFGSCTLNNGVDLSTWTFKEGCTLGYMFYDTEIEGTNIVFKDGTVFSNCNHEYMFYNNDTMTETPMFDIVDTENQAIGYAYREMFRGCGKLVKINSTQPWHLRSNMNDFALNCGYLVTVPEIHFYVSSKTNQNSISTAFSTCSSLEELTLYTYYVDDVEMYANNTFLNNTSLKRILGNLDLSHIVASHGATIFKGCSSLEYFETTGSFGGKNTKAGTLDVSASSVFNIAKQLEMLASNNSGYTQTIKLHADVYSALTDETLALATSKNYTLASA